MQTYIKCFLYFIFVTKNIKRMIQRIQTIWLFLASVTILALFLFPYTTYTDPSGIAMALKVSGKLNSTGGQSQLSTSLLFTLQAIATVLLGILPLVVVANFKNRKKQASLIALTMLLTLLFATWLFVSAKQALQEVGKLLTFDNIGIGALLVPLYIIFLLLALRGINKDNKLIRSADRLR